MKTTLTPAQCDTLEALLGDLESHARKAALLADEHRAAVSTADAANLARCVAAQQQSASQLSALESRRIAFLRSIGLRAAPIGLATAPGTPPTITLTQIAALAPKPRAAALTAAATRARLMLADALERRESVRLASLSLMAHMQGLVRQISRHLSDTKTYAPPHRLATPGAGGAGATAGSLDFTT